MTEKILFDKDLIYKVIGRKDVDILFLKYSIEERKAFYKTNTCKRYKLISFEKVINI